MPITPSASFALQWTRTRKSRAQHPAHGPYFSSGARANTGASPTASTAALSLSPSRPTTTNAPRKCSASARNTATNSKALLARTLQFLGFVDIRRIPFNSRQKQDADGQISDCSSRTFADHRRQPNRQTQPTRKGKFFAPLRGSPPLTQFPFADHRRQPNRQTQPTRKGKFFAPLRAPSRITAVNAVPLRGSPPSTKPTNPTDSQNEVLRAPSRPFADHRR